jgi:hypothetical protein
MPRFRMTATGTKPLLMHNARLSNPLDEVVREIKKVSGKRKKTDGDYEAMARLEHAGGLYWDDELPGPYLPGQNFEKCLVEAARISKRGKDIERGVFVETDVNPLVYDGPRDIDELWKDANFLHMASVKVGTSRVTRTRPQFREWVVAAEGTFDDRVINLQDLRDIATTAGTMIGLGDWRPRYGRFTAKVEPI